MQTLVKLVKDLKVMKVQTLITDDRKNRLRGILEEELKLQNTSIMIIFGI